MTNKKVGVALGAKASMSAEVATRHNMAIQHLYGAAHFASGVRDVENEHSGKGWGPWFNLAQWNFVACITLAIAALEANLNELIDDVKMDKDVAGLLQKANLLTRYQIFLKLHNNVILKRG
jgi:hypothetical protein